jgi:hypothetical protein
LAWQTWHTQPYDGWRWQNVVAGFSAAWQVQPGLAQMSYSPILSINYLEIQILTIISFIQTVITFIIHFTFSYYQPGYNIKEICLAV